MSIRHDPNRQSRCCKLVPIGYPNRTDARRVRSYVRCRNKGKHVSIGMLTGSFSTRRILFPSRSRFESAMRPRGNVDHALYVCFRAEQTSVCQPQVLRVVSSICQKKPKTMPLSEQLKTRMKDARKRLQVFFSCTTVFAGVFGSRAESQ